MTPYHEHMCYKENSKNKLLPTCQSFRYMSQPGGQKFSGATAAIPTTGGAISPTKSMSSGSVRSAFSNECAVSVHFSTSLDLKK